MIFSAPPDHEIVTIRETPFNRAFVFKAWTDPLHLANWWGPKDFTNSFHLFDFIEGGKWEFTMHGPNKASFPNKCVFLKINPPEMIAWDHLSDPRFKIVVTFEELIPARTRITFKMLFDTAELCRKIKLFAVEKNEENMDRLEDELRKMAAEAP